ncbi:hypothetical protein GGR51DRAFT_504013 [Nemania sp. FL0031]|nr:hypothetical protein GGR51DRAFT_504013 [Nemania sp. FL0031]
MIALFVPKRISIRALLATAMLLLATAGASCVADTHRPLGIPTTLEVIDSARSLSADTVFVSSAQAGDNGTFRRMGGLQPHTCFHAKSRHIPPCSANCFSITSLTNGLGSIGQISQRSMCPTSLM